MKKLIILLVFIFPFSAFAKYEVTKQFIKQKVVSHSEYTNNESTWVDMVTTTAAYFQNQNNIKDCPTSGSRTTSYKNSKKIIQKVLGFWTCVENIQLDNDKIEGQILLKNGIIYYYKKDPTKSPDDIKWLIESGTIKRDQDNPITNVEIYIKKNDKITYSFYILKSDVHYQNYNGYLNVALAVHEKRRKNELEWYRQTKSKQFGLNQIKNTEVKKLYDMLYKAEKHFKKFDKKKFKPIELDKELVNYLLSIKPSSEWNYITRAVAN